MMTTASLNRNYEIHFTYEKSVNGCESCTIIRTPLTKSNDLNQSEDLGWWIEVFTAYPACIYYFGTFENTKTAEEAMPGFIDDLVDEGSRGLIGRVHFYRPKELTVDLEESQIIHFPPGIDIL